MTQFCSFVLTKKRIMDYHTKKHRSYAMGILLFPGVVLLYLCIHSFSHELLLSQKYQVRIQSKFRINMKGYGDGLDSALAKASMKNNTVIIAMVNKAYVEKDGENDKTMLDIFLSSFRHGEGTRSLIDHVLIVAVDQTSYDRCRILKLNCFRLKTDGVDFEGEKTYMSEDFIKMMWRRTLFLLEVLKLGYNFVFTDTDIMWFRNPFTRLSKDDTEDLQISTDRYLGDPWSQDNPINTGFYFVRSNNKTITLFETWYGQKDNATGQKEQDVLFDLIRSGLTKNLGLRVRFLETIYFSGFCEDNIDFREITIIHANCCRGITAKMSDLKVALRDWILFRRSHGNSTVNPYWNKHNSCVQSWE